MRVNVGSLIWAVVFLLIAFISLVLIFNWPTTAIPIALAISVIVIGCLVLWDGHMKAKSGY